MLSVYETIKYEYIRLMLMNYSPKADKIGANPDAPDVSGPSAQRVINSFLMN